MTMAIFIVRNCERPQDFFVTRQREIDDLWAYISNEVGMPMEWEFQAISKELKLGEAYIGLAWSRFGSNDTFSLDGTQVDAVFDTVF